MKHVYTDRQKYQPHVFVARCFVLFCFVCFVLFCLFCFVLFVLLCFVVFCFVCFVVFCFVLFVLFVLFYFVCFVCFVVFCFVCFVLFCFVLFVLFCFVVLFILLKFCSHLIECLVRTTENMKTFKLHYYYCPLPYSRYDVYCSNTHTHSPKHIVPLFHLQHATIKFIKLLL